MNLPRRPCEMNLQACALKPRAGARRAAEEFLHAGGAPADVGIILGTGLGSLVDRLTQQGIYEHFKAIAECVDIPICVYNIPTRTGRNIEPETILRMAELPGIAMVKEATGSIDQATRPCGASWRWP